MLNKSLNQQESRTPKGNGGKTGGGLGVAAMSGFERCEIKLKVYRNRQTAKHRIYIYIDAVTMPAQTVIAFARSGNYFFGILNSQIHEIWSRALGTQLRERESGFRYTPTTCFETFPFPRPSAAQTDTIAQAAKRLDDLRSNWLTPPEWHREEVLEFPGTVDGPWRRFVHEPDARGIGTVRYPRLIPKNAHVFDLKKRTLTDLYNAPPTWLQLAHRALDEAVFAAYG